MSDQIQYAIFSINPYTGQPYPKDSLQVADGQGTRVWQDVFQTISSQSATIGSAIGYLPSSFNQIYGQATSISTIIAVSYSTLSTQIGLGGIPGSITGNQLQSTMTWVQSTSKYISTGDLVSSMTPFLNGNLSFMLNIQSTVIGLGTSRYVSTLSLQSTTTSLQKDRQSTIDGLGTYGYISTLSLQSTINNLGLANYISSSALTSSLTGLLYPATSPGGNLGVVVTGTSDPPFINFNTLVNTYLATNTYFNTANAASYGIVYGVALPSTAQGLTSSLGSYGYVSTATLLSTSYGIQAAKQNIFIDRSGATNIFNSQVYISSVNAIVFLSSFIESSIVNNSNLIFSSMNLQLDVFSSLITSNSRITAEIFPTLQFDSLTNGALTSKAFTMSTFLQREGTWLSTLHETQVMGITSQNGYSNIFQQPIKISIPGSAIINNYQNPYVLYHSLSGAISYQTNVGFRTPDIHAFFASTNSYFLTIQNLSF